MKATGDVCERCRWQRKRAKRSGSGRNFAKRTASEKISGTATGIVRRIDDLGRVVIPKEIRRTMRIREGGLVCRLGRCFCYAEVSTGHPHPITDNIDTF